MPTLSSIFRAVTQNTLIFYLTLICASEQFGQHLVYHFLVSICCVARTPKVAHIKGRLLDQAVIVFNCVPFKNWNFSKRKEIAPRRSEFFPLRAVHFAIENHFYHIRLPPLSVTHFLRTCSTMETMPMVSKLATCKILML